MDKDYQKAINKAAEEISLLLKNTEQMTMLEIENVRNYAKTRTNLNIDDNQLSPEQKAWKTMYEKITESMKDTYGKEEIQQIDETYQKIESMKEVRDMMADSVILERKINNLINEQSAVFYVVFFDDKQNPYKKTIQTFVNDLDDVNITDQEKLQLAKKIIAVSEEYKKNITDKLHQQQEKIYELFQQCKKDAKNNLWEQLGYKELMEKWIILVENLYQNREKMISTIEDNVNINIQLAQITVDQQGKQKELTAEQTKKIAENAASYFVKISKILNEEELIRKELDPLSHQLLGDYTTYADDVTNGLLNNEKLQNTSQTKKEPPTKKNIKIYIIILIILFVAIVISLNI